MPPGRKLSSGDIKHLEASVHSGAPWLEESIDAAGAKPNHWAFLGWQSSSSAAAGAKRPFIVTSRLPRRTASLPGLVPTLRSAIPETCCSQRQSHLRVDAEIVRDVDLAASGLLAPKIGGPSVFPPQPAGAMSPSQKTCTPSEGEDRYRRGMCTFVWRVTLNPGLIVFDAPVGGNACARRTRSNTPLQG